MSEIKSKEEIEEHINSKDYVHVQNVKKNQDHHTCLGCGISITYSKNRAVFRHIRKCENEKKTDNHLFSYIKKWGNLENYPNGKN